MKKLKFLSALTLMLIFELGISYGQSPAYLWAKDAGGTSDDEGYSVATDTDGHIIVTGYFSSSSITFETTTLTNADSYGSDMFIVKLSGSTDIEENNFSENNFNVYPNPTHNQLIITNDQLQITDILITDITGKQVKTIKANGQSKNYTINVEDLPTGLYLLKVTGDKGTEVTKFIKE